MSINKFGLSENISKTGVSKDYINSIFINLIKRLEEKVDKNLTYPLNMRANKISSSFVPDTSDALINKLYLDKNLTEQEANNRNYTEYLVNNLSTYLDSQIKQVNNILIKNIMVKNSSGYIPVLNSNLDSKYGFKVHASSQLPTNNGHKDAYNVFNFKNSEWITDGVNRDFWIQIDLPEEIEIYKFALRGKNSGTDCIYKWALQGSNNVYANRWFTLYNAENEPVNNVMKYYSVPRNEGYSSYRIFVREAEGKNPGLSPGLSYWQLFKLDSTVVNI